MSKDPIKLIIGLGFTGVLTLMGMISFISLSQMKTITGEMSELLNETNTKIFAANTMRDSIRLRGESLYNMSLTDDYIKRDEYRIQITELALQYKMARDTLYTSQMTSQEAKLLDQIMIQTRAAKLVNDLAAEMLLSDLPDADIKRALRDANEARRGLLEGLDKLVLLQEENAYAVINDARKYQESIGNIILYLSLAAFFIALYIAQLVVRETSRKNYEIRYQAAHDELTKLVNRKEFNRRIKDALNIAVDNHATHALCFMDLDKFKIINDTCGHKAGDELLKRLTRVINNHIRSHDTLARIGGDEFGLLLEGCSLDKAIEIAEGIVSLVKNYEFNWQDRKFHVGISIGLVMITHKTENVDKALSQADTACYAAKDMGRNQVHIHGLQDERAQKMHKELNWVANINSADSEEHFSLYLQSIHNLQEKQSTSMYEVLLRLSDDDGTLITPGSYIPAAERFSLMKDVDRWVIKNAFTQLSALYRSIPDCDVRLFINISSNSLTQDDFSDFVIQQFKQHNIAHDAICLEISEIKAVKNINHTADVITLLRKHNIRFALDDFGRGMSSFSYLKNLPVDYLKIDGDIIKNISQNTADKAMVAAINQIGRVMNIETVAKHVENVFTLNQLKDIGIDYAQGYYLDKPTNINDRMSEMQEEMKLRSVKR